MQKPHASLHRAFFVLAPLRHVVFGMRKKIISFRENFWPGKPSKTVISPISEAMKNGRKTLCRKTFRGFQNVDTALNILHISTQVPNVWEYVSDGPYREYMIGKVPLKFKHVMPREINGYSAITVMVIQGIRAIGKGNMTQELTERFSSVITEEDKEILLREARTASGWIYKEIRNICGGRPS